MSTVLLQLVSDIFKLSGFSLFKDKFMCICNNHRNRFCYICEHVVFTDFVKQAYHAYFGCDLWDQDRITIPISAAKHLWRIHGIGGIRK